MKRFAIIFLWLCLLLAYPFYVSAQSYDIGTKTYFDNDLLYNNYNNYNYTQQKVHVEKMRKQYPAPFVGISAGVGGSFSKYYRSLDGTISLEVAGSCNERFAMGGYFKYQSVATFSGGLIFIHGNHNERSAFMWGLGCIGAPERSFYDLSNPQIPNDNFSINRYMISQVGTELRLGCKFKSSWYIWFDCSIRDRGYGGVSDYIYYEDYNTPWVENYRSDYYYHSHAKNTIFSTSISVGYKFKIKQKSSKTQGGEL